MGPNYYGWFIFAVVCLCPVAIGVFLVIPDHPVSFWFGFTLVSILLTEMLWDK